MIYTKILTINFSTSRFLIEESINSLANQEPCKSFPNLPVESPEMLKFMKDEDPVECGDEDDDWVSCDVS